MPVREVSPLPLQLEEIDREWLTAALATRAPGTVVEDYTVVDEMRSTCTKLRLRLRLNEAGRRAGIPELVILKGGFEEHSRQMADMHEREGVSYRDLGPALGLHMPECYFVGLDTAAAQSIIIMEDLVQRGVRFCEAQVPETFEQARRRLSSLAAFHAQTWGSPELEAGGRWSSFNDGVGAFRRYLQLWGYLDDETWQRFVTMPQGAAASVDFHDADWVLGGLQRLESLAARLPKSVIVGDRHLGNLYEEADGTPGFFDCMPAIDPAMAEVAYFVASALDPRQRRDWERALVSSYLDELTRLGVAGVPSLDEAMHQYAAFLLRGFVTFLINEPRYQKEAVNTVYTMRFSAAMLDHRTKEVVDSLA